MKERARSLDDVSLTERELMRYHRQIILPGFGIESQKKLKAASVLVIGAGGLGCPVMQYLAAAGVGHIGIVDNDVVSESNLHRQILYDANDIGKRKVDVAEEKLKRLNPEVKITTFCERITSSNAMNIVAGFDFIADGSDNFPTRYLMNDACVLTGKPLVYASVYRYEGHVSVFNYRINEHEYGPNYRDLFPEPPASDTIPDCNAAGVSGVLTGIVGNMQANEVIKIITGSGDVLSGKYLVYNTATCLSSIISFCKNGTSENIKALIDYEEFCGTKSASAKTKEEVTASDLRLWIKEKREIQYVDVREEHEVSLRIFHATSIPFDEVRDRMSEIDREKSVIIICESGKRSAAVAYDLRKNFGYNNVFSLKEGIGGFKDASVMDEMH